MSVEREIVLTPEGYRRIKDEINYLSTKKRDEVADRIRDARQFGDISENAEYDDAKNEQAMLEQRISGLEEKLRSAKVIEAGDVKTESVGVGTRVTLQNVQNGDMIQYHIVGSAEADPSDRRLSNESPVGRAIMGRRPGDVVNVVVPKGTTKLKIITIERA
jgi:transcription elongation factor GreA